MRKLIVGLAVGMMLMNSCSSSKQTTKNSNSEGTPGEVTAKVDEVKKDQVLSYKRTSCLGRCPVYDFRIYSDKTCDVDGKLFFVVEGEYEGVLTQAQYDDVLKRINDINYFDFDNSYDDPYVQDIPATYISVQLNGKSKSIKCRYDTPAELKDFLTHIHGLATGMKWGK